MKIVKICIGSSCHLHGSEEIVELFKNAIEKHHLEDEVVLAGSFCLGKCNQKGVTIQVDDELFVGVSKDDFKDFFEAHILSDVVSNS